uniref:Uncharacterized protein n=1 Tax=Brassica oleracea var. oleracea TaxID=109376 RepID=A0A0D3D8L3_BRAOL
MRRLNQQMMEMLQRMYPNEVFPSMDICPKTHRSTKFRGNIPTTFSLGIFRGVFRRTSGPRNVLGNLFPRNSVGKFRGISEERRNSEELFPRTCFVGMSSEYRYSDDIPTIFSLSMSLFSCSVHLSSASALDR